MAKTKISEFSSTPGNNTDIDGINIAEGCAPSGINDAIRELMSQLKDFQTGAAGDSFNGPVNGAINGTVGATTPNTGAFTTLSASGAFSLTGDQVQVSEGGTGATTASGARTNLGLAIGTNVQAYDAQLDTLSGASADRATFLASDQGFGFRNRIINGDMRIDQRNNGAALSLTNNTGYPVDRFIAASAASTTISFQQSSIAPAGFTRSLSATVTTPKALAAADLNRIIHRFEGFNIADLGWGTASAQPVTISFWVRASVTGIYTIQIGSGQNYLASYTINSANTWEYKTVTVAGSTSGTWPTDNSAGAEINFVLGAGSNWLGSVGSWGASPVFTVSGATNYIGTNGATFYITGVQLEAGSVATPFERRPYGTELQLCQRYYQRMSGTGISFTGYWDGTNAGVFFVYLPTTMRAISGIGISSGAHFAINNSGVGNPAVSAVGFSSTTLSSLRYDANVASGGASGGKAAAFNATSASAWFEILGGEL